MSLRFTIEKKMKGKLGRVGAIHTPHGVIHTPAFVAVGTKGTVKALTPEQVGALGAEVVLANTYHLYLQPGSEKVKAMGGLGKMMNWTGPTMTDSGGFQAFSLGAAFGEGSSKVASAPRKKLAAEAGLSRNEVDGLGLGAGLPSESNLERLAKITEDGVEFKSVIDGSTHFFTPEKSIEIQHDIGADIIFAFDECTSPAAPHAYQKEAMDRTHRWAKRSLDRHREIGGPRGLFGIVQGGRFEDLRKESARSIGEMAFDGFGIGGSFDKEDMDHAVGWVNSILPEEKPRHLLGIGEPVDLFGAIAEGCDTFDCVTPTRIARNGTLYTRQGKLNIMNSRFTSLMEPIDSKCACYTCCNYTCAYLAHLFRAKEIMAATLASIHNLYFIVHLVREIRTAILDDRFEEVKASYLNAL